MKHVELKLQQNSALDTVPACSYRTFFSREYSVLFVPGANDGDGGDGGADSDSDCGILW